MVVDANFEDFVYKLTGYLRPHSIQFLLILRATTGTDNIPAKALKIAAPHISIVLANSTGYLPSSFKVPKVTFTFKGDCKTELDNYRPISVLPPVHLKDL